MTHKNFTILTALFMAMVFGGISKTDASDVTCDRECLKGFMTQYINAMINKKPDSLQVADNVKITENCKEIKIGDGYWKTISGSVGWRLDVVDLRQGGIGALFVIKGDASVLYAVRLKVANNKITEIETMVVRNTSEGMLFAPQNFKSPEDTLMTKMPNPELLNTRDEMIAIASKYPEAMKNGTGSFNKNGLYFSKPAFRLENGQLMAGPGCTFLSGCADIGGQTIPKLAGMVYKTALVDEQAGIVLLRMNFGPGSAMGGGGVLDVFEAFKVFDDSMHCVMAIMQKVPEGTPFGWDYEAVGARESPLRVGHMTHSGNATATSKGVALSLGFSCDHVILAIYDSKGKLVHSKTAVNARKGTSMFLPMDMKALPPGHFIGCVRCFAGGKRVNSFFFPLHTIGMPVLSTSTNRK